jgi:hypothetical protein
MAEVQSVRTEQIRLSASRLGTLLTRLLVVVGLLSLSIDSSAAFGVPATFSSTVTTASAKQDRLDEPAFRAFHDAVLDYVRLQRRLREEVPGLIVSSEPRRITDASDTLAAAIQRSRRTAKKGDIFNQATASVIAERLRTALKGVDIAAFVDGINDETRFKGQPRVHMRFPEAAPMATMPAAFLELLPALPVELEYRFVGRHLILRDRDAALVIDYVIDAIPAR